MTTTNNLLSVHEDEGGYDPNQCCAACRADTSYGDHEDGCPNEPMSFELIEALALAGES